MVFRLVNTTLITAVLLQFFMPYNVYDGLWDARCFRCRTFRMWDVWNAGRRNVGCSGCGILRMWDIQDIHGMFGMSNVQDVGCSGCGMFEIWSVSDVGCGCLLHKGCCFTTCQLFSMIRRLQAIFTT